MPSGAHQGCDAPFTTVKGDIVMAPNLGFDNFYWLLSCCSAS